MVWPPLLQKCKILTKKNINFKNFYGFLKKSKILYKGQLLKKSVEMKILLPRNLH